LLTTAIAVWLSLIYLSAYPWKVCILLTTLVGSIVYDVFGQNFYVSQMNHLSKYKQIS
jgi:hypothetical protein